MSRGKSIVTTGISDALLDRVVSILEEARSNVVRAVNTQMVKAYWLIGREIVEAVQGGEERAEYGKQLLSDLSTQLTQRYGSGFSVPNLQNFRKFYLAYAERVVSDHNIQYPAGTKSGTGQIQYPVGTKSRVVPIPHPPGRELALSQESPPKDGESPQGFSPQITWSHYRALMRVENVEARDFYEREPVAGGWDKRTLERQIHSYYYERILKSRNPEKMLAEGRRLPVAATPAIDELKNPYVLEFLGLPEVAAFQESDLERAVITQLQSFLLELGNGFAFVTRQKHIRIEDQRRWMSPNCRRIMRRRPLTECKRLGCWKIVLI
jgi:predicted nuclease of restriction endonuclease-like (RecB) superfamily